MNNRWAMACVFGLAACGQSGESANETDASIRDGGGKVDGNNPNDAALPIGPPPVCQISIECNGVTIPDEPKIACSLRIEDGNGGVEYDGAAFLERRGRSSLTFPKPQYALELRVALDSEESNATNLLGMGKEDDWILNGAHIDRSLFRNPFFYDLYQSLGGPEHYAPQTAYCNVELEGEYLGLFQLGERIERDDDRLQIEKDTEGTGASFIIKQDDTDSPGALRPVGIANGAWQLLYPKKKNATQAQKDAIRTLLSDWQRYTISRDDRIFDIVDLDSAVDYVLLEELAKNNDAYYLSMHLWRNTGGKIHFSMWDLDLSFGQPEYNDSESPERWVMFRPPMICRMANRPQFQSAMSARWTALRAGPLSNDSIEQRIDYYVEALGGDADANFVRWPIEDITFNAHILYPATSHADEVAHVRAWLMQRLEWMDANMSNYASTCTT